MDIDAAFSERARGEPAEVVRHGRAVRLRRRRTTVLGAALACLLVIVGVGVGRWVARPSSSVSATNGTGVPAPPAGTKWVGVGRQVAAVPASWPVVPGIYCREPRKPYVTIVQWHVVVACEPLGDGTPVSSITIQGDSSGGFEVSEHVPQTRLPTGWLAVPSGEVAGGTGIPSVTSEIQALEAAGFTVERRQADPRNRWERVTTDPEIGTPAHTGSTVIVYDHGTVASSATLTGRLLWVGGPAPGTARPHAGTVHVVNADDSVDETAAAGPDGRWTILVPPGTYRVAATSPGYLSDAGSPDACAASGQATVAAGQTVTLNVYCQLM